MNLTNFNHITIGAPDLEGLARSLQQMGFTLSEWRPDGLPEILLGNPDDYVILQLYPFAPAGIHAVGVVPSRADLPPLDARTSLELYGYPLFSTRSPGTPPIEVFQHANGAARLDHLASVAPDLEAKTQNWIEKLGITPLPDVHHPKMLIRPIPVGTRVLELLAPNGPESPIHSRPVGPTSFISVEVFDLDRVLNLLRKVDLTFEGPVEGFLPNTEIITVRGEHNYGLTVQFLHRIPVTPSIPERPEMNTDTPQEEVLGTESSSTTTEETTSAAAAPAPEPSNATESPAGTAPETESAPAPEAKPKKAPAKKAGASKKAGTAKKAGAAGKSTAAKKAGTAKKAAAPAAKKTTSAKKAAAPAAKKAGTAKKAAAPAAKKTTAAKKTGTAKKSGTAKKPTPKKS